MSTRRWSVRRRATWVALAVAALWVAGSAQLPTTLSSRATFPRAHPAALAHLLVDFSNAQAHPLRHHSLHLGSWRIEEEKRDGAMWLYRVSFECGVRCAGWAHVSIAHKPRDHAAPAHAPALFHSVRLRYAACTRLPLLPWPEACDEMEIEWQVSSEADNEAMGSAVEERAVSWCGLARWATGACAARLRLLRADHLVRLRTALELIAPPPV